MSADRTATTDCFTRHGWPVHVCASGKEKTQFVLSWCARYFVTRENGQRHRTMLNAVAVITAS